MIIIKQINKYLCVYINIYIYMYICKHKYKLIRLYKYDRRVSWLKQMLDKRRYNNENYISRVMLINITSNVMF